MASYHASLGRYFFRRGESVCLFLHKYCCNPGYQNGGSHDEETVLEDDWSVDTSEEAVKSRMEKLTEGATSLTLNDDLEKSNSERLNIFYMFVEVGVCVCVCVCVCVPIGTCMGTCNCYCCGLVLLR